MARYVPSSGGMRIPLNIKTLLSTLPPAAVAALALSGAIQTGCGLRVDEVIGEDRAGLYGDYGDYSGYTGGYEGMPEPSGSSSGSATAGSSSGSSTPTGGPKGTPSSSSSNGGGCDVSSGPATGTVGLLGVGLAIVAAQRRRRRA
jgi:MYXO-CTERM domain-containing protein